MNNKSLLYPVVSTSRRVVSLDGMWRFSFDAKSEGVEANWANGLPESISMPVPASFCDFFTDKESREYCGDFWYQKDFFVPETVQSKVQLRFGSITHRAIVFCNGVEVARHEGGFLPVVADVTDEAAVKNAVDEIIEREGRIDVLVNNAGFGISGAVEFTKTEDAKRLFDTNFFGMVNMNRAVIPVMREAGRGRIVNIGSVAGQIPIPFQTYYSAAKAATNSYTMALANELRPYGVTVCAVQPGDIKTGFTKAREKSIDGDDIYGGRIGRSVARMEHDEQTGMEPSIAGRFIADVAMKKKVSPIYTIGASYSFLTFLTRFMSQKTMNKIIGSIYAK